ncbi:26S proteasome regulatory subunit RPN1 [Thelohanellus kitauei]|uniref:26S proteasome regulatory subunit RPN1 n=1 Tax=Thelohanellus kitauei TaxID=669202 RepID=A0A0C2MRI3_THEKT|nr:26S proteasome regulatory subunit RPN1 [Thelohanellus kitauei]
MAARRRHRRSALMGKSNDDYSAILLEKKKVNTSAILGQEDESLRAEMLDLVEKLKLDDPQIHKDSLAKLKNHCQTGPPDLACLPKYLQFLHDKIDELKAIYDSWPENGLKEELAIIISALSIMDTDTKDCLQYRKRGSKDDDLSKWGLEYIRHLAEELANDFETNILNRNLSEADEVFKEAMELLQQITEYYFKNNCEIDAVDIYIDLDYHERLDDYMNENNVMKIGRYLQQCSYFFSKADYLEINRYLYGSYSRFGLTMDCFMAACRSMDVEFFHDTLLRVKDDIENQSLPDLDRDMLQKQMCYMLAHYGIYYNFSEEHESETRCQVDELTQIIHNRFLIDAHTDIAIEFDILKPYSVDEICRIPNQKYSSYYNAGNLKDPVYTCLASAFVSAFSNAAFKTDLFLMGDHQKWLLTDSETILMNCVACIGLLHMWDIDEAFLVLDKFLDHSNSNIVAGALLGIGVASCNTVDHFMSPYALLVDQLTNDVPIIQRNAIIAMGLSYAGTDDSDVSETMRELVEWPSVDIKPKAMACLAIGLVACGSNSPLPPSEIILEYLNSVKDQLDINDPYMRLIPVGVAMIHIGRYENISQSVKNMADLPGDFGKWCFILLKICSNFGTGNCGALQKLIEFIHEPGKKFHFDDKDITVGEEIKQFIDKHDGAGDLPEVQAVQKMVERVEKELKEQEKHDEDKEEEAEVNIVDEKGATEKDTGPNIAQEESVPEPKNEPDKSGPSDAKKNLKKLKDESKAYELLQGLATVGVAFISIIEDISQKMALRLFNSFLQFGSIATRRAVPVALGILSVSNPQITIIELLSKLSHDHDDVVSLNAILALGIVGAGTNNSRIGNLLRNLNVFHHTEPLHVFAIRISQGLLHLSKGVMTLTPLRAENTFLSPVSIASLLVHAVLSLDVRHTYLSKDPHLLFWLVPAMKLRALITYDTNGKSVPVTVRVGQAVDETGQAGKPKRITGFQTHRTPILLNVGERVELATNKYIPYTPVLENIVLVKEDPNATGPDLS